jgi:hypothetical protein
MKLAHRDAGAVWVSAATRHAPSLTAAAVALLLVAFTTLSYRAVLTKCATYDETLHSVAGHVVRHYDDYRLDIEDPPLFLWWGDLPHRRGDLRIDTRDEDFRTVWDLHDRQWIFVTRTLYQTPDNNQKDGRKDVFINRSRAMFVAVAALLGALTAWWGWKLAGPTAAVTAAVLFCFDPNFLAHGALVKNDVPLSLLMLGVMLAVWELGRRATPWRVAVVALCCGLALGVKFSGIVLGAFVGTCLLLRSMLPGSWDVFRTALESRRARLGAAVIMCLIIALTSWLCVWWMYGFRFTDTKDLSLAFDRTPFLLDTKVKELQLRYRNEPHGEITQKEVDEWPESTPVRVIGFLEDHRLMPRAWIYGLWYTYATSLGRGAFLRGQYSDTGWWYFFPLAMLYKTPTVTLLALLGALGMWAAWLVRPPATRVSRRLDPWDWTCLLVPLLLYGASAISTPLNLGLRHVLPMYPFLFLVIAVAAARAVEWSPRAGSALALVLALGLAAESLPAWPHYIAFFNVIAGGSRGGLELLTDSNLDWGQDLPLLAEWQRHHPDRPLYLSYFGMADPSFYGIRRTDMPDGYPFPLGHEMAWPGKAPCVVAISATNLKGVYASGELRESYAKVFGAKTPIAVLGGSIYLYEWTGEET